MIKDNLLDIFNETMDREGINIEVNNKTCKVLFRKEELANSINNHYSVILFYAYKSDQIKLGDECIINNEHYMILNQITTENPIYQKYRAIKLDQKVTIVLKDKIEKASFYILQSEYNDKLDYKDIITLSSTALFKLPLTEKSKRIRLNDRFFTKVRHSVWKVYEIDYINNIVYLYCKKDTLYEYDNTDLGIADDIKENTPTLPNEVLIEPTYNSDTCFELNKLSNQVFNVRVNGIDKPIWDITLDSQGIPSEFYDYVIDNKNGEFTVKCLELYTDSKLKFIIKENTTGLIKEYLIKLVGIF